MKGKTMKKRRVFLQGPKGVKIHRHHIGGDNEEIRFTTPTKEGDMLVAIAHGDKFVWLHKEFRNR